MDYLLLIAPSANRVYAEQAPALAAAELTLCAGVHDARPVQVAGVDYVSFSTDADPATLPGVAVAATRLALFRRDGEALWPVRIDSPAVLDDDLVGIPKYTGKTNEQLTRLLLNLTLGAVRRPIGPRRVLDPMCGRGTTLTTALTLGHDAVGVEQDEKALDATSAYLRTYLRRKRLKHHADLTPVRRDGKRIGRRLDVEVTPADRTLHLTVFSGDARRSADLCGKRGFDAVVTDAPYGVVHGSHGADRRRSPESLLREAVPVWAGQLYAGGALGVAFNTLTMPRDTLVGILRDARLEVLEGGAWHDLAHRVDSSIHRDVLVAVRSS